MSGGSAHLRVELGNRSYDIVAGSGLLADAGDLMQRVLRQKRVVVVTDANVAKLHLKTLASGLAKAGIASEILILPPGEGTKDFAHFEKLCEDIDTLLGDDKRKFHWTQLKEKFGSARFHWAVVNARTPPELQKTISALVGAAQAKTQHMCVVCGQLGQIDYSQPHMLMLCDEHVRQRSENKLPNFWCEGYK